ncbi:hypothetical protein KSS87_003314 [Heliosperma pusillum]|nr:hypothetical protein KSS87_003314 [Heliosperma pusillum]
MEVEKVFHMKKGVGHTSYAKNSQLQKTVTIHARPVIEEGIREVYFTLRPECLMVADMGCSSGPNALLVVSRIIDVIEEASRSINRQCPQFGVFLNDLPGNDFNALFNLLQNFNKELQEAKESSFKPCFVSGIPKSFYRRVFPDKFLHFVHSSYSIHWLSQVPRGLMNENGEALNKGNIYIAKTSPQEIHKAYYAQFKKDFTLFLELRSREMVSHGAMVLVLLGTFNSDDPDSIHELLGSTLHDMVLKGVIEPEKLDKFNMPLYSPTVEEVRKLVEAEGSVALNKLETFTIDWSVDTSQNLETRAKFVAKSIRAANRVTFNMKIVENIGERRDTKEMDVEKVFHMNKGTGNFSYARNSLMQRIVTEHAIPVIKESIREVYFTLRPECFMMADMGCSSGPNAFLLVSRIIDIIEEASRSINRQCPQFGVFLNDLPGNDFNALFNLLPDFNKVLQEAKGSSFGPCFVSGIPKSFYGRVFPDKFLHFVHSSYSVHWLSQVPRGLVSENGEALNKGNIYIAKTSPIEIHKAYYTQFKKDFTLFLRSRSKEMVSNGGMVVVLNGSINNDDRDLLMELLDYTLQDMVLKGLIEQEKLDKFNMPFYAPTVEEVRKLVETEGSFALKKLETFTIDWSVDTSQNLDTRAKFVAKTARAVTEPLLETTFTPAIMDDLFLLFEIRCVKAAVCGQVIAVIVEPTLSIAPARQPNSSLQFTCVVEPVLYGFESSHAVYGSKL